MTVRNEPSVGMFNGIFAGKQSVKSHEVILADALQAQVEDHQFQATQHQAKALVAGESLSRLERVRGRITELLA